MAEITPGGFNFHELMQLMSDKMACDFDGFSSSFEFHIANQLCHNEQLREHLVNILDYQETRFTLKHKHTLSEVKSCQRSSRLRSRGNDLFKDNKMADARMVYTQAVAAAPIDKEEFAVALANRAACLVKEQHFAEALDDVLLSLESGLYPRCLLYKLLLRQAECLHFLGRPAEAHAAMRKAQDALEQQSNLQEKAVAQIKQYMLEMLSSMDKLPAQVSRPSPTFTLESLTELMPSTNRLLPGGSGCITVRYSPEKGRHVVARRDVKKGDVMFVERPYALVVLPGEQAPTHCCEDCCKMLLAPLPCVSCDVNMYCGVACRTNAWATYHQWECSGSKLASWKLIGIAHLSLRVLLVASHEAFKIKLNRPDSKSQPQKINACFALSKIQTQESRSHVEEGEVLKQGESGNGRTSDDKEERTKKGKDYTSVYGLVTNFEKMHKDDVKQYAVTSFLLMLYLKKHSDFFTHHLPRVLLTASCCMDEEEAELLTVTLLLRHMAQLVANGHAVTMLDHSLKGRADFLAEVRLATAIYPGASMMNHSCRPNIMSSHHGDILIVKAIEDIPCGTEVFNCYGPQYPRMCFRDRRSSLLGQYMFTCDCTVCMDPSTQQIEREMSGYKCSLCMGDDTLLTDEGVCPQCDRENDLTQLNHVLEELQRIIEDDMRLKLSSQYLHPHNEELYLLRDQLARQQITNKSGDPFPLLEENASVIMRQYGKDSIQMAHELNKMVDAAVITSKQGRPVTTKKRATTMAKKSFAIFSCYYGPWSSLYQSAEQLIKTIEGMEYRKFLK